jgi:hypothetical protein
MRLCCNTALSIRLKSQGWLSEAISGMQAVSRARRVAGSGTGHGKDSDNQAYRN